MKQGLFSRHDPSQLSSQRDISKNFSRPFLSSNIISNIESCTFAALSSMKADMPDTVALESDDTNGVDAKDSMIATKEFSLRVFVTAPQRLFEAMAAPTKTV